MLGTKQQRNGASFQGYLKTQGQLFKSVEGQNGKFPAQFAQGHHEKTGVGIIRGKPPRRHKTNEST